MLGNKVHSTSPDASWYSRPLYENKPSGVTQTQGKSNNRNGMPHKN